MSDKESLFLLFLSLFSTFIFFSDILSPTRFGKSNSLSPNTNCSLKILIRTRVFQNLMVKIVLNITTYSKY